MKLGIIGVGKMGSQIVKRVVEGGHSVVATDLSAENIELAVSAGAEAAENRIALVAKLEVPPVIWLMIPAAYVDDELDELINLLPKNSIIIDGGNSDFRLTRERAERCAAAGIEFVDVGTSGGVAGYEKGFSMMVGGSDAAYKAIEPIIKALAQDGGYAHFGPSGAGHYVKMVHNAVEYGIMQSYAEGYRLLHESTDYDAFDLAEIARVWQHGSIIASSLNEDAYQALKQNPAMDGIDGYVSESGEARWALEVAKVQGIELPAIQAAFDERLASQQGKTHFGTQMLAAMRNIFGGHQLNK